MEALDYAQEHRDDFVEELKEFLRIPSVSTQAVHKPDMERAVTWLQVCLLEAGFERAEVMATPGHPVLYAEWLAAGPQAPTILIYGHYDVQPPDPLDKWHTPPFTPTVVGDDIFARGASDDKGQLFIYAKAAEAFKETAGAPPVNIKCIFEGEEEIGSPSLTPFIHAHKELLAADLAVISDTAILGKNIPTIIYALRGLAYIEVEVTGPSHDLHSGLYGGAVHNPINALCAMIASLQMEHAKGKPGNEDGYITIPGFYERVRTLSAEERAEFAKIPFDREAWLKDAGISTAWGEPDYTILERTKARPTLDVNGIWGGYIEPGVKTVLPSKAYAKISMRLVPDQDPETITQLISEHLKAIAPPTVQVEVRDLQGGAAAIVRRDSGAMQAAFQAYAEAFGTKPVFMREGGSIPVVATFKEVLGIETILMGFGLPDDNLHAPNEKVHQPNFYRGVETVIRFMTLLGSEA